MLSSRCCAQIFCAIIEAMALLIREWGSIQVKQVILCSHCRRAMMAEPTEFPIENLTTAVRAKLDAVDCVRVTGGLHPAAADVMQKLFQSSVGHLKSPRPPSASSPQPPVVIAASPPAANPLAIANDFQKQMDDFAAQMEALLGAPAPATAAAPAPGAIALPGMSAPIPSRPSPALSASPLPQIVSPSSPPPDSDVEDAPTLNPFKQALMEDPHTILTEVRLDLLVPDLKLVYLKGNLVKWEDLSIEKQIGRGGFALVYKGTYKGEVVAIKKLEVKEDDAESAEDSNYAKAFAEFRKEAFIMTQISDPHCVVLKGVCLDPFALITEFVPNGDLYSIVNKPDKFSIDWHLRLKISLDMARGMQFMHVQSPPIIHNDLKTPNVLMMSLDPTAPVCAKVSDFGLSMQVTKMYKRLVDNPVWTAPEIMMGQTYNERADVYAFGVMLWELLERKQYFSHVPFNSDLEIRVMQGERAPISQDCMPEYEKLIRMCWDQNPSRRPDFGTIVKIIDLMTKKMQMGLAVIGPSTETAAKSAPPGTSVASPALAAAAAAAAASPAPAKQMVKSWSSTQLPRTGSGELAKVPAPVPGSASPNMTRSPPTSPMPVRKETPPAVAVVADPPTATVAVDPAPVVAAAPNPGPVAAVPAVEMLYVPPPPIGSPALVPKTQAVLEADSVSAGGTSTSSSSGTIRVAAIGGANMSNETMQSIQDQLKSSVKRAPSLSQSGNNPNLPSGATGAPAGALKKMGSGPAGSPKQGIGAKHVGSPKQAPAQGGAAKQSPGPGGAKQAPAVGGLKSSAGAAKKAPPAAAVAPVDAVVERVESEPAPVQPSPAPTTSTQLLDTDLEAILGASTEDTVPEGAIAIASIRQSCDEVEQALKTGTLKSFGILKILGGDEARHGEDQVERAIIEVVQLVRSMRSGNQSLMDADTSHVDSAQFQRQLDAAKYAQAVIDALLAFCRSAKAVDGGQRGILTAHDIGDVDIDVVRQQSAAFAGAVKAYLAVLRPIKEWFRSTTARFFYPIA